MPCHIGRYVCSVGVSFDFMLFLYEATKARDIHSKSEVGLTVYEGILGWTMLQVQIIRMCLG